MFNVVYDPFLTRTTAISEKILYDTFFFTLFVLSRTSDNTTSQNIGGTDAWAVPHLKFLGRPSPVSLVSSPKVLYNYAEIILFLKSYHFVACCHLIFLYIIGYNNISRTSTNPHPSFCCNGSISQQWHSSCSSEYDSPMDITCISSWPEDFLFMGLSR